MQLAPQDGVAALADMAPAAPTPPTRVSVAAAAKTLLLMDMEFLSRYLSRTLRTAAGAKVRLGNGRPDCVFFIRARGETLRPVPAGRSRAAPPSNRRSSDVGPLSRGRADVT